jgi:methionyl-tRNA formyltransferase
MIGSGRVILDQFLHLVTIGYEVVAILPDKTNTSFNWRDYTSIVYIEETELYRIDWDLAFMNEFGSLLNLPNNFSRPIINFHSGLLPYFKGKSSNLLAFLNSKEIGLSVHLIDSNMDAGKLLFQKSFKYDLDDTYESIASKIYKECVSSLSIIIQLIEKKSFLSLADNPVYYSTKLLPKDAIITDFSFPLEFYQRIFLLFGKGTGVYISYKSKKIKVNSLNGRMIINNDLKYYLIGTVVNKSNNSHFISIPNGFLILGLERDLLIGNRLDGHRFYSI